MSKHRDNEYANTVLSNDDSFSFFSKKRLRHPVDEDTHDMRQSRQAGSRKKPARARVHPRPIDGVDRGGRAGDPRSAREKRTR